MTKVPRTHSGKQAFSHQVVLFGANRCPEEECNWTHSSIITHKDNWNWIQDLSGRYATRGKHMGSTLELWNRQSFIYMTLKVQEKKVNIDRWNNIKLKSFSTVKEMSEEIAQTARKHWEAMFLTRNWYPWYTMNSGTSKIRENNNLINKSIRSK